MLPTWWPISNRLSAQPNRGHDDTTVDWQTAEVRPTRRITEAEERAARSLAPATGAWREDDPPGARKFAGFGPFITEAGAEIPWVRIAYETFGELTPTRDNAVLIFHALTGDSHVTSSGPELSGAASPGEGWWSNVVGPGKAIDTNHWFVVCPNVLGGCQGSTGPASLAPDGYEWANRFPRLTIRDQTRAFGYLADQLGIDTWAALIGGSMGGMHALEWAITWPESVARLAILAAPPFTTADQIAHNTLQIEAITADPGFAGGRYYDAPAGAGPNRGLSLARRMAMLNYRSSEELDNRFERSWQSQLSPVLAGGKYAVESYLDFHGNKFTRRFDANSYLVLTQAMNSHDLTRDRTSLGDVLAPIGAAAVVIGVDSDRYFPVAGQAAIAEALPGNIHGTRPVIISSPYGHDAFLIEHEAVGAAVADLMATKTPRRRAEA